MAKSVSELTYRHKHADAAQTSRLTWCRLLLASLVKVQMMHKKKEGSDAHKMHTNLVSEFGLEVGLVRSLFYTTPPIGIAQLIKAEESAVDPSL